MLWYIQVILGRKIQDLDKEVSRVIGAIALENRIMIPVPLWERLVARVQKDHGVVKEMAERIMNAALGFLDLCAKNPEKRFSPTPLVDVGWHTFLMYTQDYAKFCLERAGRFIHHEPNDNPAVAMAGGGACATVAFMKSNGVSFDAEMWRHTSSGNDCTVDCDGGSGPCQSSDCTCS